MKRKIGVYFVGGLLCLGGGQAWANCVVCGSEGSCYDQPITLSGNCECSITSKFGSLICRPKGVCDPQDNNACSNSPGQAIADVQGPVVRASFLDTTAAKDATLASALWGAMDQEMDARGVLLQAHLAPGVHTGTLGTTDHRSFKYEVQVRQLDPTVLVLKATLEEEGTGLVQRYEGALYHSGLQGELVRLNQDGSPAPVAVWDFRQKPDRGGKDPGSSQ